MTRRNHLDDFTRRRMIGKLEEGRTVTSVAAEFGINKSVVSRAGKAFQTTSTAVRKVGGGQPRPTIAGDDIYIFLQAKRSRRQSSKRHCSATLYSNGATSVAVYCGQTPSQRGLFAHCPECCLPLKVDHRRPRLQWCRAHKHWTTVNGVVSSLRMRVGSVPEAILNVN
ncbi:transposable element Tcb2 transposase [Trichonephila clavipes]|nr:transposable element Tcb2 transposase [Trichonephila clavipes]